MHDSESSNVAYQWGRLERPYEVAKHLVADRVNPKPLSISSRNWTEQRTTAHLGAAATFLPRSEFSSRLENSKGPRPSSTVTR